MLSEVDFNTNTSILNLTVAYETSMPNTYIGNYTWYEYSKNYFEDNLTEDSFVMNVTVDPEFMTATV